MSNKVLLYYTIPELESDRMSESPSPVAYLGFYFGGGSKFFWKSRGI